MAQLAERLASAVAGVNLVPMRDIFLTDLPAEKDEAIFNQARKIENSLFNRLALHAEIVEQRQARLDLLDGIARAIYITATGRRVVIVRIFVKKTQKTPPREIELARQRAKEVE